MSEAFDQLRAEGFRIGPDKLHRLRVFGIHSTRCGREYRISDAALTDLRYLLSIERNMQLARDHDGLCLELAYRNYHTIPWDRVHQGARDRVEAALAKIDRELHRANDWAGLGFHPRRIQHLARQLANHFVPKRTIKADPAYQLARDLTEQVACMILPVTYNDSTFAERDVIRLITMMRVAESAAIEFAPKAMVLLEQVTPWLRQGRHSHFQIVTSGDAPEAEVRAAVQTMRIQALLIARLETAGVQTPFRPVPSYPIVEDASEFGAMDAALRSLSYAGAFEVSHDPRGIANMAAYLAGDTQGIDTAIDSLATSYKLVPTVIGVDHAK
ncbi:MAG: hypothetical protein WB609_06185 [Candidatus Cybelea sp.]